MKLISRIQPDKIKFFFFIMLCSISISSSFAQNKNIDSLQNLLKKDKPDTNKVIHSFILCGEYTNAGLYDSALYYGNYALQLAQQINFRKGVAKSFNNIGNIYSAKGDYPKTLDCYLKALKINEELGDRLNTSKCLANIGNVYRGQSENTKALGYYLQALKIAEKIGNKQIQASVLCNIGLAYQDQRDCPTALECYFKALKISKELGNKNLISIITGNIGGIYSSTGESSKALDYLFKGLKMAEELGDKQGVAIKSGNIGAIYFTSKKYTEAEKFMLKALAIDTTMRFLLHGKYIHEQLSILYEKMGKSVKALEYYKKAMVEKDTLFNQEKDKQITRKEMNFEFEKKEAYTKAQNEKQQVIAEEKNRKQKIIIWSVTCGLLLMVTFAGFIFRSLRITHRQKQIIEIKNIETEHQKKIIEEKNKETTDSINYASRIQQAMLTSQEYISKHLPAEYFIFYQPKDIVSGDFYWAFEKIIPSSKLEVPEQKFFYFATSDCTGHGVPGAFMSLLNISFLNENVIERNIVEPNKILNEQRKEIIKALNPKGTENSKDCMDCALCKFDFNSMTLTFAAANNPIWLVRNAKLIEYLPDKMPVGKYNETDKEFTQQTIQLQKGDIIYTFTDGYADQFGGPNGKKFKYKQFEELLLSNHHLPMKEQHNILEKTINSWKGKLEQVDDVLVIGVKI